ncbi:NitT/TauT family transport system substrate-binding protein [Azospirillum agricola]|uniref:ABC transporter substrate-binding protein n=1 Tax=Azospirillum agricola TaxID=1720247 RepID=UPI001F2E853F|nr:ABC transporter substrate-binding protein [Azospirillum agricola]MBP2228158.1 NitT/TauT family transport system substrate-binding protein [Azospirillum agricola]
MMLKTIRTLLSGAGLAAVMALAAGGADAATSLKFTLDWKFEGPAAAFLVAADKGYFAAEGLDVTIDTGNGSAGAVTRVASGAYDIGMADFNSMMEFNDKNPDKAMKAAFIVYDIPPFSVFALKKSGIAKPADLAGKTLGAPVFDAPRKLFPAYAKAVGVPADGVTWKSMDPPLREPMLMRGEVQAISGFYFTSLLNLRALGVTEKDLTIFNFADAGVSLYGNALIPSPKLMKENPEAVKGFLRAVVKGWRDVVADPAGGIQAIRKRDPLIDDKLELDRLKMALEMCVLTPDVKADGMGGVRPERLAAAIDQVALAFGFARKPAPAEVFDASFLPAAADRKLTP